MEAKVAYAASSEQLPPASRAQDLPVISSELKKIIRNLMLSKNRDSIGELVTYMIKENKKNQMPMTEKEGQELDNYLNKFTFLQQN
jgi:hypothetical protein